MFFFKSNSVIIIGNESTPNEFVEMERFHFKLSFMAIPPVSSSAVATAVGKVPKEPSPMLTEIWHRLQQPGENGACCGRKHTCKNLHLPKEPFLPILPSRRGPLCKQSLLILSDIQSVSGLWLISIDTINYNCWYWRLLNNWVNYEFYRYLGNYLN